MTLLEMIKVKEMLEIRLKIIYDDLDDIFDSNFWEGIKEKYPDAGQRYFNYINKKEKFAIGSCYCDIENFFDNNGIIIQTGNSLEDDWWYCFSTHYAENGEGYKTRDEAKEQAILKAFEILQNKGGKNVQNNSN